MARGNPNPSPATRFSKDRQPENKRRPDPLLAALKGKMTPQRADVIAEALLLKAEAGDVPSIAMVWERTAGKVPNRNENGQPGDFELDLSDEERENLRSALKVIRGRRTG